MGNTPCRNSLILTLCTTALAVHSRLHQQLALASLVKVVYGLLEKYSIMTSLRTLSLRPIISKDVPLLKSLKNALVAYCSQSRFHRNQKTILLDMSQIFFFQSYLRRSLKNLFVSQEAGIKVCAIRNEHTFTVDIKYNTFYLVIIGDF